MERFFPNSGFFSWPDNLDYSLNRDERQAACRLQA
jgi:hypothetical protein